MDKIVEGLKRQEERMRPEFSFSKLLLEKAEKAESFPTPGRREESCRRNSRWALRLRNRRSSPMATVPEAVPQRPIRRYSNVAVTFHWVVVALVLTQVVIGFTFAEFLPRGPERAALFTWHKTLGATILLLTLCAWPPAEEPAAAVPARAAALAAHRGGVEPSPLLCRADPASADWPYRGF